MLKGMWTVLKTRPGKGSLIAIREYANQRWVIKAVVSSF